MTASLTGKSRTEKWESFLEYYYELDSAGEDLDAIAEFFGVTRSWMLRKLREAGIDATKHHKPSMTEKKDAFLEKYYTLRDSGIDAFAIADEMGTTRANLLGRLRLAGVDVSEHKLPTGARLGSGRWGPRYVELREQGLDNYEIAKVMGVQYATVMSLSLKLGLREKLPRGGPGKSRK